MGTMTSFPRMRGGTAEAYFAKAGEAKGPAVVVIQEWWGLQGQIKAVCDRLAAAGFSALAPDLYGGKVVPYHDEGAAAAAMQSLDFKAATEEAVRGAVVQLRKSAGKVGLTGFCMGGAVTVIGAARIPELDAAVCFYGLPPPNVASGKDVRVPLQGHFASEDDWITPDKVDAFEKELKAAGKTYEIHRYKGHHAFMNEERGQVYDARAATLAWDRMLGWFRRHLG
jgi:carboxymethylenebutenolidase